MDVTMVCVSGSLWLEKHAAEEFVKYVKEMTGLEPEIADKTAPKEGEIVVSVGRNAVTTSLIFKKGVVQIPENLGEEGFIVKSVKADGKRYLVLLGGSPRGTLYAVYHYLEALCKVGFFADGEQVPKLDKIPIDGIDIFEKPRFPMREYMMDCEYTSYWWGWDEWKQELDWAAKHRFNLLSSNFDLTATWRRVWKKFGVEVPSTSLTAPPFHPWAGWHQWDIKPPYPEDFQEFIADLIKKFVDYGRNLGMKMAPDYRGFLGQVPKEFYEAYRDKARFIDVRWGDSATGKFIYPTDPLYKEVWKAYLEEYIERYGTDHIYACQTLSEMEACETPEEQKEIDISHAKSALDVIRSVDPQGTFFTLDWTWLNKKLWQKENVKAYLDTFQEDTTVVWGLCADRNYQRQLYKELDYYFGKPWLLGFLVAYGGTTMLHGDLAETIKLVQEVVTDKKAENCLGISVQPEALRHNYLYFDLLSRLGWKPSDIELESFLEDYAIRRYGKESAPKMVECLKELVASVYSTTRVTCPLYMVRITNEHIRSGDYGIHQSKKFLPHLQKALQIALEESDRLGDSTFYQHDIIDIARQFLSDLFNLHVARLAMAFQAQNRKAFEREASVLLEILTSQETLLSSSDYFCLQPIIDKAMALPNAPKNYDGRIRDILTVWADKSLDYAHLDYAHRDYYELVRFYYHPRVDTFIDYLSEKLANRTREIKDEELTPLYHKIEQDWVKKPFKVEKSEKYAGTPVEAATQVIRKHRIGEAELKKIEAME